jgi:hypothetical protein
MTSRVRQPPTEVVLGAPLQLDRDGDEVVVRIRDQHDRLEELKRFTPPS